MDPQIKQLQDYLKTSPLGVSYNGLADGYLKPPLVNSVNALQTILKDKLSKSSNKDLQSKAPSFIILSGEKVITTPDQIKAIITELQKEASPNIKGVQEIFNSNPFGISYNGPKDGVMNDEFIAKLHELETKITEVSGANVSNQIISGDKLLTDSGDLSKTFSAIKSYQEFLKSHK